MSTDNRKLIESAPFSPALAHHELAHSVPADLTRPSAWEFEAALVFIDISGFTNLCTRLDIDTLQRHINQYFGELIGVVTSNGGDVLRFAGDALFCSWSLQKGAGETTALATATRAACRCVLELTRRCGTYAIPEIQAELSIHTGIGAGALCAYRVGTPNRWELLIAGGPLQQVAAAEGCAALGEAVCSAEAWALTEGRFAGEAVPGGGGCMRLLTEGEAHEAHEAGTLRAEWEREACDAVLFTSDALSMQQEGVSHLAFAGAVGEQRHVYEAALEAYVHEAARSRISSLDQIAERRGVVVAFAKVVGLDAAFADGVGGLERVQACLATALECVGRRGGLLRQFLLDDKGVVIIFTFGLSQASFEDNAERGLATAKELDESLAQQGLSVRVGITAGEAFCGLVGVPKRRCEYGVMGPSVNLAARLMGMCDDKGVSLLCCDRMHAELHRGDGHLAFRRFDHVRVKGYAQPVAVFHPQEEDAKLRDVKRMLAHVPIFSMLAPREQTQFLRFMREQAFAAGCEIITEGDEGDEFYILVSGTVRVTQWQDAGDGSGRREKRTLVECLSRGDSFGDVALIHGIQRTSTVTATSDAVCMSLDRTTFQKLFGGAMAEVISSQLERAAQASAVRINSLPPSARPPSPKRSASGRHIVTAQQRFAAPGGQAEAEAEAEAAAAAAAAAAHAATS